MATSSSRGGGSRPLKLIGAAVLAFAATLSCGDGTTEPTPPPPRPDPPRATTVTVTPATASLVALGDTLRLTAEVRDQNGQPMAGAAVAWSSGNAAVATVDASGLVTGVAAGEVEISATSSGVTGRAALTVVAPLPTTIAVTPDTVAFTAIGQTARLSAEVRDQIGRPMEDATIAWSSGDTLVAAIDSAGLVTATGGGTTVVAAAAGDASGEAVVTVMQSAGSVVVSPAADTIALGGTRALKAEAFDENGHAVANASFTWSSANPDVARVDQAGLVTGVGEGTAGITATAGSVSGTSEITVVSPDRAALAALYEATDGPNWVNNDNWLTDAPLEEWYGVSTDASGRVVAIDLSGAEDGSEVHGLSGAIPPEIGNLPALTELRVAQNDLTGSIPVEFGDLTNLRFLDLGWNDLAGPIPPELGELSNLTSLTLSANELTGAVPPELGGLEELEVLRIGGNAALTGRLPLSLAGLALREFDWSDTNLCSPGTPRFREWLNGIATHNGAGVECPPLSDREILEAFYHATDGPNWVDNTNWLTDAPLGEWYGVGTDASGRVVRLDLSGDWEGPELHGLSGSIPPEIGGLSRLRDLQLFGNRLEGPIPPELGDLASLWRLALNNNRLTGEIPPELGGLASLQQLFLFVNRLHGPIPAEFGNLASLRFLILARNQLAGPIPAEVGNLKALRSLRLQHNQLTGLIPPELGNLVNLESLALDVNALTGPIPPELGKLTRLKELSLGKNPLSGSLPQSFLEVQGLSRLDLRDVDVCVPGTSLFVAWLHRIETSFAAETSFCNEFDVAALESLFAATSGREWTRSDNWLGAGPVLDGWYGVSTDSLGRVAALDLSDNALSGRLPGSLGGLAAMTQLRIGGNVSLTGRLPLSLAGLTLREFDWSDTDLCAPNTPRFREWLNGIPAHDGTGEECAPLSDREILEAFYHATGGENWTNSENWLTDASLGEWYGVSVNSEGRVTRLTFYTNNNLAGLLPDEVTGLSELEKLTIWGNPRMTVPLSPLGDLISLQALSVGGFTTVAEGNVPPELGRLRNLRELSLSGAGLSGPIPPALGDFSALETLRLAGNDLTGQIPPELGDLAQLTTLSLDTNELTGAIPPELGNLASLRSLGLWLNRLTGPIPPELGGLADLRQLQLGDNEFTGAIPPELGGLRSLEVMELYRNRLTGGVPPELGNLASLSKLVLNGNAGLAGAVPASLTALARLDTLATGGTGLCAPATPEMERWLDGLGYAQLRSCHGAGNTYAYLTQRIQSPDQAVPLVAGKPALLRAFVSAPGATAEPLPPVRATLYLNGAEVHRVEVDGGSGAIPATVDEGDLSKSANAKIPAEVVQPGLEMVVEIDPDGTLDLATLGVPRRLPATGRAAIEVARAPVLNLTLVPLLWTEAPDSAVVAAARGMAADPEGHELLRLTRAILPMGGLEVEAHDPVLTSSNLGEDMISLLTVIRTMEGGTGHYHGLYAGNRPDGIGGQGVMPGRVGWSLLRLGESVFAHELGHNMSLRHAPATNRLLDWLDDPLFPRADGSIGAWGYDFEPNQLVPPWARDVMGGSGNTRWISGYHFTKALRFQVADEEGRAAAPAAAARSLLLWGGADAEGEPFLEPAFVVDAPPSLPASSAAGAYALVGRDNDGAQLFSLRFDMDEISHAEGASSFAFALPLEPEWEGNVASITLTGPEGSATLDRDSARPTTILRDRRTGQVRAFLRGPPTAMAAAVAPGGLSAGLGIDAEAYFSRGIPDASAWRR